MKKFSYALFAAMLVVVVPMTLQAHPGGPGFGMGAAAGIPDPELMIEHMADHLDLDESQRASVQSLLESVRPEAEALRAKAQANREALRALETSDPAYETTLNNIALSQGQLATEGTLLATRVRTELDAVLTDEQRAKLERGKMRMKRAAGRQNQSR